MQLSKRVRPNSSKQSAAKHKAKQNRSKRAPFFFFSGEEGVLLTKRRPFLSQALSNPTARERLLRYAQFYLVLERRKFKFDVFRVRVSATQICKFDFKFKYKKIRRSIFSLDKAEFKF